MRTLSLGGLIRNGLGIEDLIRSVDSMEGALKLLKTYLESDRAHPRDMRQRHVQDLMALMRERGRILSSDPRYGLMSQFYNENFGQEFPAWVEERISVRRKYV